jgi:diguanylate cyclase (GGDEF)-like protein
MSEQKPTPRGRTFLAGKVISNYGQSTIDCIVRRVSETGAVIEVESVLGVPERFHLLIPGEGEPQPCKRSWQSEKQVGLVFETAEATNSESAAVDEPRGADQIVRGQMLALRAALDVMDVGVLLLDANLKSQFINRAFRRMWALPDTVADRNPAFVALMYHGRDTKAYEIAPAEIDAYVANRVRLVREGDTTPLDLRRTNGDVVRMQGANLPNGGRMITYTYVTDIVRHMDELEILRGALDNVSEGVVLLDGELNAQFVNRKMRQHWGITEEHAASRPSYASLIANSPSGKDRGMTPDELNAFHAGRVAAVRDASEPVRDLQTAAGRHIRAHCSVQKNGGRMLTYCDITDLVHNARQMEQLATIDSMTGLYNRRHFMALAAAEWSRFQRYYRPLSVLMIDVDHFKSVNDRYGHAVGDQALISVANACVEGKRSSDIVGRIGGEEFAMLLPETDLYQARIVADRICTAVAARTLKAHEVHFRVTASIGFAAATVSMPGFEALLNAADQALYQAKDQGRNRIVAWLPPPAAKLAAE